MSYLAGQPISGSNGTFDESMLRNVPEDMYFLNSGLDSVDSSQRQPSHNVFVKEEPKNLPVIPADGSQMQFYASPSQFPETGYTTPAHSSISSEGNIVSNNQASGSGFTNARSMIPERGAMNFNGMNQYGQEQLEIQQQQLQQQQIQQVQLQQQIQQQLELEQQDLRNDVSESSGMIDTEDEQVKRKRALNRAAQKAFRERKEARVKQLEQQLKESEKNREELQQELEQLRKNNIEMHAENRILLQTKNATVAPVSNPSPNRACPAMQPYAQGQVSQSAKFVFPSKRDFVDELIRSEEHGPLNASPPSVHYSHEGEQMMTVSATWEYLHKQSELIDFDLSLVMSRLKGREVCHGKGPSYYRSDIDRYIKDSQNAFRQ